LSTKILIVDDEPDQCGFLELLLQRQGYQVLTAHDGKEGIQQAEAYKPDLIISDICMPGLDGAHMVEALQENPELSKTPILVISAYGSQYLYDAIKAGATDAMRKPIDPDLLFSKVSELLDDSHY
jgi:two-component system, OmpR family, alkaline phosphatase synthesis response regulator PhoP